MTPPIHELEWVRPPRQARSAQTLERILDAAEALILEQGTEACTVAEVARRAESSVGSFYSRFPDKEALLRCVFERFYEQAVATVHSVLGPGRWDGVPLSDVVESAAAFLIRIFQEKRRLVAASTARAVHDESLHALAERLAQVVGDHMWDLVQARGERIDHDDPETAVRFAVWMVMSAFHARSLTADPPEPISERRLAGEVRRMCMAYLGLEAKAS